TTAAPTATSASAVSTPTAATVTAARSPAVTSRPASAGGAAITLSACGRIAIQLITRAGLRSIALITHLFPTVLAFFVHVAVLARVNVVAFFPNETAAVFALCADRSVSFARRSAPNRTLIVLNVPGLRPVIATLNFRRTPTTLRVSVLLRLHRRSGPRIVR